LQPADLDKIHTKDASAFLDPGSKALTLTFRYVQGEPEVRIPVAEIDWPTDWRKSNAVQFTFCSSSGEAVCISLVGGDKTKAYVFEPLAKVRIRAVIPFDAFFPTDGPRSSEPLPLGYSAWAERRVFHSDRVDEVVIKMRYPNEPTQVTLYDFTLMSEVPSDDILDKKPLIDAYGQWIPENWEDKAHNDMQLRSMWDADHVELVNFAFCPLGGEVTRSLPATGFFRTAKVEGKWVLVDPHGHPFYSAGMDLVGWNEGSFATSVAGREYLFEQLPPAGRAWLRAADIAENSGSSGETESEEKPVVSFYAANIMRRFGNDWTKKWRAHILARLRGWGFNSIGNWSDKELAVSSGMPYVLPIDGWETKKQFPFYGGFPDVFSEEFAINADAFARKQVMPLKDDPKLIGWFVGNEPGFATPYVNHRSFADLVLSDSEPSATKSKLLEMLATKPGEAEHIKNEFLFSCAEKYFKTIAEAVRRHDPNHLVLGVRFDLRLRPQVPYQPNSDRRWAEMSRIFDVFSINLYSAEFGPDPEQIREYAEASGRPVMIGEFTAAAPGRGLQGLFYYNHKVRDQGERAKAYRYYVENAAANPYIVGSHWFQMVDDLPTGRGQGGEHLNYGFINVIDLPYRQLVKAAQETHRRLYDLKFGKVEAVREIPKYN
jgi:hypothetical protein